MENYQKFIAEAQSNAARGFYDIIYSLGLYSKPTSSRL
jgi:hypothetical protein